MDQPDPEITAPKGPDMAQFLQLFLPTLAFMLVPVAIPVLAVAVGSLRDRFSGQSGMETVEDGVRARIEARQISAVA